jgi:hypothetical protein
MANVLPGFHVGVTYQAKDIAVIFMHMEHACGVHTYQRQASVQAEYP